MAYTGGWRTAGLAFLGESLGGSFLAGAALMLLGVSLATLWPGQSSQQ